MRANTAAVCLGILVASSSVRAQSNQQPQVVEATNRVAEATSPDYSGVYCSGFVTNERVPSEIRLISGEQSNIKVVFDRGDYVYINKGSNQGVKVGDRYSVVRPHSDPIDVQWFKWQDKLMKAMGTAYKDTGQLSVVTVHPNVSIAMITFSCDYMQRGDIVRPMLERPSPPYKPSSKFDHFAPPSGKSVGMIVTGLQFAQGFGKDSTAYVNLGSNQGVKVGDYLRIFRYQGTTAETAPNYDDYQYKMLGFGSTPEKYKWNDLPREVIGEGIVINVSPNSSTLFVTFTSLAAYAGDYVEIE